MSLREARISLKGSKAALVAMKPFLKVTRRIVVTVYCTNRGRSGVSEVTFIVWVTQWTRCSVTLLTEAWLVWRGDLGTIWVYAVVGTVRVLLSASRVKANVVLDAVVGGTRD